MISADDFDALAARFDDLADRVGPIPVRLQAMFGSDVMQGGALTPGVQFAMDCLNSTTGRVIAQLRIHAADCRRQATAERERLH